MPWFMFGSDNRPRQEHSFERDVFNHVTKMIKLRAENDAIRFGYLLTLYVDDFLYAYMREFRGNVVIVMINNGCESMPVPASIDIAGNSNIPPRIKQLLADGYVLRSYFDELSDITVSSGRLEVQLPGKSAGIYVL
jgi:hypothetical protein